MADTLEKSKKEFSLDTNILIDNPASIYCFGEHDVTIAIQVIEELDRFKSGQNLRGESAREVTREIDKLFSPKIYNTGVSLGSGKGVLRICISKQLNSKIKKVLKDDTMDHRIISVALDRQEFHQRKNKNKDVLPVSVVLVSNDTNMRLKAGAVGLNAEYRKADRVENLDTLYKGLCNEKVDKKTIDSLYKAEEVSALFDKKLFPNQCCHFENGKQSGLFKYNSNGVFESVKKVELFNGIKTRNKEQHFAADLVLDKNISLVTLVGKAGTGKTLMAIGAAIKMLKKKDYDNILIARPVVSLSDKDIGFLPGDIKEKLAPYMQPIMDNVDVLKKGEDHKGNSKLAENIEEYIKKEQIKIEALAFIRGRSLNNTLFIIDEAQNLTPKEVKTIVTRMGENSKVVFTGDIHQIDNPYLDAHSNGLTYLVDKAKSFQNAGHIQLFEGERSDLSNWAADNL
jgi:PhoH-like ATPase